MEMDILIKNLYYIMLVYSVTEGNLLKGKVNDGGNKSQWKNTTAAEVGRPDRLFPP